MSGPAFLLSCALLILASIVPTASVADEAPVTPKDGKLLVGWTKGTPPASHQGATPPVGTPSRPTAPTCLEDPSNPNCRPVLTCTQASVGAATYALSLTAPAHAAVALGSCTPDPAVSQGPQLTPGRVLRAFQSIPLPSGKLSVQPPGGRTLVNFDTIFSTEAAPFDEAVTLLGHQIRLRIFPTAYVWHFDQGASETTDWPGKPYERGVPIEEYITHQYVDADVTVTPRVDVTWGAEYSVDGGEWLDGPGTVTSTGPEARLRIVEAKPVLTG